MVTRSIYWKTIKDGEPSIREKESPIIYSLGVLESLDDIALDGKLPVLEDNSDANNRCNWMKWTEVKSTTFFKVKLNLTELTP